MKIFSIPVNLRNAMGLSTVPAYTQVLHFLLIFTHKIGCSSYVWIVLIRMYKVNAPAIIYKTHLSMTHSFRSIINCHKLCTLSMNCPHLFCSIYVLLKSTRSHNGFLDPYVGINSKGYLDDPQHSFCIYITDIEMF